MTSEILFNPRYYKRFNFKIDDQQCRGRRRFMKNYSRLYHMPRYGPMSKLATPTMLQRLQGD